MSYLTVAIRITIALNDSGEKVATAASHFIALSVSPSPFSHIQPPTSTQLTGTAAHLLYVSCSFIIIPSPTCLLLPLTPKVLLVLAGVVLLKKA